MLSAEFSVLQMEHQNQVFLVVAIIHPLPEANKT